ncbi:MAG: hypothetical protein DCE90_10970 [Pseudanabaena sp.]|nr:MAG: hypothetical protein DCE90_10970 [Pseudanabaena sp.]
MVLPFLSQKLLQPITALSNTEKFLKALQSNAFKNFSVFSVHVSTPKRMLILFGIDIKQIIINRLKAQDF